jgi:malonyl CoA-acyl carrier protein transacylase
MAVSLAVMRVLEREFGVGVDKAAFVAGHSLGEYSALAAAGAISLADTARLLKLRGQAMQRAVPVGAGAMASLIGPKTDVALAEAAAGRLRARRLRRRQRQQPRQCGDLRRPRPPSTAPSRRPRSWARGRSR